MTALAATPSKPTAPKGVCCPKCGCPSVPVYYVRRVLGLTRRCRRCRQCGKRFFTAETAK